MVYVIPLKSHPSISLVCSNKPSFWSSFFIDTGSSPACPETLGGGNIECIPNNIALARCLMCSIWLLFVHVMKSSTYTSMSVTVDVGILS